MAKTKPPSLTHLVWHTSSRRGRLELLVDPGTVVGLPTELAAQLQRANGHWLTLEEAEQQDRERTKGRSEPEGEPQGDPEPQGDSQGESEPQEATEPQSEPQGDSEPAPEPKRKGRGSTKPTVVEPSDG